jgi:hypothetical protein
MVRQRLGVRGMAALRAANESLMPDCCTITHVVPGTPVPGGDGTETTGDVTTTTTVACRVMALTEPVEQEIAARLQGTTGFEIEMPFDTIVAEQDTITAHLEAFAAEITAGEGLPDGRAIFNEFGTSRMAAHPYFRPAVERYIPAFLAELQTLLA